jgi:hypothetical protein
MEEFSALARSRSIRAGFGMLPSANVASVNRCVSCGFPAMVAAGFLLSGFVAPGVIAAPLENGRFVGATGCQSSYCHGGAGTKNGQFLTWVKQDFHFRAYAVLVDARSARMAEALGLSAAAQSSARCTVCHSPFQSLLPARLTKGVQPDEGVSCESCHGAAEPWLRGHTRKDWTYATRVGAGMHDLRNVYVRANTCVACHQNLEPDLLAAGHPELSFELDVQSVAEPKHWLDDPGSGPRAWLVGQAVALREMSWDLAKNQEQDPAAIDRWNALAWLLARTTEKQPPALRIDPPNDHPSRAVFVAAQEQADRVAREAAAIVWDDGRTWKILQAALATAPEFTNSTTSSRALLQRRAARLILALDRLSRGLDHQASPTASPAPALLPLFADARVFSDFDPGKFAVDLANFGATLNRAP